MMDPMVPEADAQEQHTPVVDDEDEDEALDHLPDDPEVPEADAFEQARSVPHDDDERD